MGNNCYGGDQDPDNYDSQNINKSAFRYIQVVIKIMETP